MVALGLAGTERSQYFKDLVDGLENSYLIIGVRGKETSSHPGDNKFFLKNDCSRLTFIMEWVHSVYKDIPKIGIGISLGAH